MAEESRIIPEKSIDEQDIEITLDSSVFRLVDGFKFGDKGQINISGVINREVKDEEHDKILKFLQITKVSPSENRRARI